MTLRLGGGNVLESRFLPISVIRFGYGLVAITTGNNVSSSLSSISTVICVWFDAVQVAFLIK